ncbi:MAG: hypothetical protein II670_08605 [Alphaproteobacteria bacterium]|nr:hypothetical protein [Alphaproteobacteria bacterium]
MKNIKINEKQDKEIRKLIKENLDPNGGGLSLHYSIPGNKTPRTPGEIGSAVVNATKAAEKVPTNSNISNDVSINADPDNDNKQQTITVGGDTKFESVIISKKQLDEIRLKKLKENSEVVKIKNFLK